MKENSSFMQRKLLMEIMRILATYNDKGLHRGQINYSKICNKAIRELWRPFDDTCSTSNSESISFILLLCWLKEEKQNQSNRKQQNDQNGKNKKEKTK